MYKIKKILEKIGPIWFPIVGCYHQIKSMHTKKNYYHLVWDHLSEIYGSIVGLKLGFTRIVVVSGYDAVKEVLCGEVFEGRPDGFFFRLRSFGERLGVAFVDGPFMRVQRKFSLNQLRKLGLGKTLMYDIITNEVLEVVKLITAKHECQLLNEIRMYTTKQVSVRFSHLPGEISDHELFYGATVTKNYLYQKIDDGIYNMRIFNRPTSSHKTYNESIEVQQLFDVSTLNVLWTMIAGYRFPLNDEKLLKLLDLVHNAFHMVDMSGGLLNQMPFLRILAPSLSGYNSFVIIIEEIMEFLKDTLRNHHESDGNDFISVFLREIDKNENNAENTFTEKQLLVLLEDFFMAGSETTSNSLTFVIYYLIKYPTVQAKIHLELDKVINVNNIPTINHRQNLVYLEATLMEIQRYSTPVPVAIPHRALRDCELMGFKIPKGTYLLPSIWSVHMDENHWKDPFVFRPERFIDEYGKIIQDNYFMPFGIGRRKCIGEILARNSMFLFISIILQKFELRTIEDISSIEVLDGMTLALAPFKVQFIPRF
ncbi:hypothetical protein PGB90_010413 [Kerria lacca]